MSVDHQKETPVARWKVAQQTIMPTRRNLLALFARLLHRLYDQVATLVAHSRVEHDAVPAPVQGSQRGVSHLYGARRICRSRSTSRILSRSLHVLEHEVRYCLERSCHYAGVLSEPPSQQERDLALDDSEFHLGLREIRIKDTDML